MPYAPQVQFDPTPLYQGIANLGQGLAAGIIERRKKEEEKQKKTAALSFARKFMPMVNPEMANVDDKTLGAGIEAMGVDNVLSMADSIAKGVAAKKEAEQRQALIQQQIVASQAELLAQERNRRALQQAASPQAGLADQILSGARFNQLDPTQQADPARAYIRAGGTDPQQMNELNSMAARMTKGTRPGPQIMQLGKDSYGRTVEGIYDGNNFSPIKPKADPKADATTQLARLLSEQEAAKKAGRLDWVAKYQIAIDNYGKINPYAMFSGGGQSSANTEDIPVAKEVLTPGQLSAAEPPLSPQDQQAVQWAKANPNDPRAAAIMQRIAGK